MPKHEQGSGGPALAPPRSVKQAGRRAHHVARDTSLRHRDRVDQEGRWPAESLAHLAREGLTGLHVPVADGGCGLGLEALTVCCGALGAVCPSSALCFGMHAVASAVLAAQATDDQRRRYLTPIARGEHLTSLALSESGSGSHFYLPTAAVRRDGEDFVITGAKAFITNGGHADSYVVSTAPPQDEPDPGRFSLFVVDADQPGLAWGPPWRGFGMRGTASAGLELHDVRVPSTHLLGAVGDQVWYAFEIVAPYFLMAMAGTYLGLARAILDETHAHLVRRRHGVGEALADVPLLQHRYAGLWMEVQAARQLALHAARRADAGDPNALPLVFAAKAKVGDVVVAVANEAMTMCGGVAYGDNALLARFLRDARAAPVMSPTTDLLKTWCGRVLLDRPLL